MAEACIHTGSLTNTPLCSQADELDNKILGTQDTFSQSSFNENYHDEVNDGNQLKKNKTASILESLFKKQKIEVGSLFNCVVRESSDDITSPLFDPKNFDPKNYLLNDSFRFLFFADTLDKIEDLYGTGTGSRKLVFTILTNFFRILIYYKPTDLVPSVYLLLNKLSPEYENIQIGIGEGLIIKAMSEAYSRSEKNLKADLLKFEDLGLVAEANTCKFNTLVPPPVLTIRSAFLKFKGMAECQGKNSQKSKLDLIRGVLISGKKKESKYIIRFLLQRLRIGINMPTIVQCLGESFYLTRPSSGSLIGDVRTSGLKLESWDTIENMCQSLKEVISIVPNVEIITDLLLKGYLGKQLLETCGITPGIPIQPMLARPIDSIAQIFEKMSGMDFTCEYKYDGERAQIHMNEEGTFQIFSRNLEKSTDKYPDVIKIIQSAINDNVKSFIVDSEVVAFDRAKGTILPFQILTTRKRKDVAEDNISVNVCVHPFDLLYFNGESLTKKTFKERRTLLHSCFKEKFGEITYAKYKDIKDPNEFEEFWHESITNNSEGLMAKTLTSNSSYEPSKRSSNWLKIKKDYVEGVSDSFDLVPIGAFYGTGKRNTVFGSYLLAVYNDELENFQTVCKTASGFTDELLKSLFETMKGFVVSTRPKYYQVSEKMEPDVWFEPKRVWECRVSDLSLSPVHTAALGLIEDEKGIGMRFPRFLKIREDKGIFDASKAVDLIPMYKAQLAVPKNKEKDKENT